VAKRKISFEGVPEEVKRGGGGGKHIPEGDYIVKILEGDWHKSDKGTGIKWLAQVTQPTEHKGVKLRGYTSLKKEALWSLRNLIFAATGKNVAGKTANFDPDTLVGKIVGAEVTDNEYTKDGKTKITSQINTFFPKDEAQLAGEDADDDDDEEEEEEETEEEDEDLEEVEVEDI
jgi:hypothetical protein